MKYVSNLETKLNEVFAKNAPQLPRGAKDFMVKFAPIVSLIVGVFTLLATWNLWSLARRTDRYADYARELCSTYDTPGCGGLIGSNYTIWIWLGLLFLLAQAVLYIAAFSGLNARAKRGWDYLFYGALLNVVYAVISLFNDYDKVGHFLGALVGSAIGFYLLFQIREFYNGKKASVDAPKVEKADETKEK